MLGILLLIMLIAAAVGVVAGQRRRAALNGDPLSWTGPCMFGPSFGDSDNQVGSRPVPMRGCQWTAIVAALARPAPCPWRR